MKHKHYDCIIAWANGEIIEVLNAEMEEWEIVEQPSWYEDNDYRIKLKQIGLREDEIKKLAEQSGMDWDTHSWCWLTNPPHLEKFAELVRQDEREACAKLCLEPIHYGQIQNNKSTVGGNKFFRDKTAQECAAAIRARG